MAAIQLPYKGWRPRPHQVEAWKALRNPGIDTVVLAWHRRAGKDAIALHDAAIRMVNRVGNYWHMLPQADQARKAIWDAVDPNTGRKRWEDAFPPELISHVDNQAMKITMVNGSTWQVLGSDNYNSLVGTTPVHITLSEAALADPNAFGYFRPILLENNGTSLHISSTRGRNHFYELFKLTAADETGFAQLLAADETGVFTEEQLKKELKYYITMYGENIGRSLFLQEYMSDWDAATIGAVWGSELKQVRADGRARPCAYDSRYPVMTAWDIGVSDLTVIIFFQEIGNVIRVIDWYADNSIGLDAYAEVIHDKPYVYLAHFAPHDIAVREWTTGLSRVEEAKRFGIKFERVEKTSKEEQIAAASHLLRRTEFNVIDVDTKEPEDDCEYLLDALGQYRFKFDRTRRTMSKQPEHNWSSHYADAYMTMAVGLQQRKMSRTRQMLLGNNIADGMRLRDIQRHHDKLKLKRGGGAWG